MDGTIIPETPRSLFKDKQLQQCQFLQRENRRTLKEDNYSYLSYSILSRLGGSTFELFSRQKKWLLRCNGGKKGGEPIWVGQAKHLCLVVKSKSKEWVPSETTPPHHPPALRFPSGLLEETPLFLTTCLCMCTWYWLDKERRGWLAGCILWLRRRSIGSGSAPRGGSTGPQR